MRISLCAAAALAVLSMVSCDEMEAQVQAKGSTVTIRNIIGTGPDLAQGFAGIGKSCTNFNTQYFDPSTNTLLACVNTNPLNAVASGVWTTVNSGGTSGLPSSGASTIPYVISGTTVRAATGADVGSLFTGSGTFLKNDGTLGTPAAANLPNITALLKGNGSGGAQAAMANDVIGLFNSGLCSGFLKSDGTCGSAGAALPTITAILKGNGSGGAQAANSNDIVFLFGGGSCSGFLKSDGTCAAAGGGVTLPNTTSILKGNNAGNAVPATAPDVISLFGACTGTQVLAGNGTCVAQSGGATLPNSAAVIGSNSSGAAVAATASNVVSLFGSCTGSQILSGAGTCINAPPSTIPSGPTSGVGSLSQGQLYNVTDASSGILPFYFGNTSNQSIALMSLGGSGALQLVNAPNATPTLDIVTSVVPRKSINETITGLWTSTLGHYFTAQSSLANPPASTGALYFSSVDSKFHQIVGTTDTPLSTSTSGTFNQTIQNNGTALVQRPNLNFVPGSGISIAAGDNSGTGVTSLTISSSASAYPGLTNNSDNSLNLTGYNGQFSPGITLQNQYSGSSTTMRFQANVVANGDYIIGAFAPSQEFVINNVNNGNNPILSVGRNYIRQYTDTAANRPTCDVNHRGAHYIVQGTPDDYQVCLQGATANAFNWYHASMTVAP